MPDDPGRDEAGRFKPGTSGFPAGKPPGTRSKIAAMLDGHAEVDALTVYERVKELALEGDVAACKLILDKAWPSRRGRPVAFRLEPPRSVAELPGAVAAVLGAVSAGGVSVEEGSDVIAMLDSARRALEASDLEVRLRRLEETAEKGKGGWPR